MSDYLNQPILVTGLPRSGTSMVAGLFDASGAWTGTTVPGNSENPKGFFEHQVLREKITKQILIQLDVDPLGVKSVPPLKPGMKVDGIEKIITNIIKADGYGEDQPWLYKGAKLSLIWPIFDKAFPAARWIIVRRNPEEVIDSCLRTSFMKQHSTDRAFWENFVVAYEQRLELLESTLSNVMVVETNKVLAGDYDKLKAAIESCGLSFDQQVIESFVCQDYWHAK